MLRLFTNKGTFYTEPVSYTHLLLRPAPNGKRIRFAGLDPNADYYIEELDRTFGGDELMYAGLAVPILLDFEAVSYTMRRVK